MINIKLLFIILDEGKYKKINVILNRFNIKAKTLTSAFGTASPSLLDYFGLTETKKEIFMAIIPDYYENEILSKLDSAFKFYTEGTGVAFTIPISSSNKFLSENFNKSNVERKRNNMSEFQEIKYYLIITIVLEGYLNQVMDAAKRAGSNGGTVIKGRSLRNSDSKKILGFEIEPEKEIILTVVEEKNKTKVMEEITKEVGIKTPGMGICFSLPIDNALGFKS